MAERPLNQNNFYYVRLAKLGEGTYASVYKADLYEIKTYNQKDKFLRILPKDDKPKKVVAVKKIKKLKEQDGLELNGLREVEALRRINSEYVLKLVDVFMTERNVNIVVDFLETDLEKILRNKDLFLTSANIKMLIFMITKGVSDIHSKYIVHRDLKPSNILIDKTGRLKIADFGLARDFDGEEMTESVFTRWYRPPELFFGSKFYTTSSDIWSLGLIIAEIILRIPVLPGDSDIEQLDLIFKLLGFPNEKTFPNYKELPNIQRIKEQNYSPNFYDVFKGVQKDLLVILEKSIVLNPDSRISAENIFELDYFKINKTKMTYLKY